MIKARLVTKDSFTGEDTVFDVELPEFTADAVRDAYHTALVATDWEGEPHRVAAWHPASDGGVAAFVLADEFDACAGQILVVGFAYRDTLP